MNCDKAVMGLCSKLNGVACALISVRPIDEIRHQLRHKEAVRISVFSSARSDIGCSVSTSLVWHFSTADEIVNVSDFELGNCSRFLKQAFHIIYSLFVPNYFQVFRECFPPLQ